MRGIPPLCSALFLALFPALDAGADRTSQGGNLVILADVVHTAAGAPIRNGMILIENGRITAVGPAAGLEQPEGWTVLRAPVATPGLVDAHSSVGLAGSLNIRHDREEREDSEPIQPELSAFYAYNPSDPLVEWVRSLGVTTVHTGHAPGQIISGGTMIVKTRGKTVEDAILLRDAMVAATLGDGAVRDGKGGPGTPSKAIAMLRAELIKAGEYASPPEEGAQDEKPRARDLRLETLAAVLAGERPLLVTAHRARDILAAIRLQEEFGFRLVLDGATECATLFPRIKQAGIPVLLHPTMQRPFGETANTSFETAANLYATGIPCALQTGYESYVPRTRVLLFEAAVAASNGLGFGPALELVTISPARILGIADRVGSLEAGKDGDVALFDGDPFETTSHCIGVVIEGVVVSDIVR